MGQGVVKGNPLPARQCRWALPPLPWVRLVVWCKVCQHQVEPEPAEMADR